MIDQLIRHIDTTNPFKRIVSLVPSQTELICDLGLQQRLVGVTKFCVHPEGLKEQSTIVGGTKSVKWEILKSLHPDIALCNKEENTLEIVQELEKFTQVHVADINTLEDCYELIEQYGRLFGVEDRGKVMISEIKDRLLDYNNFIKGRRMPKVAYMIWKKPWMLAGGYTFINHLLGIAGYRNGFEHLERYPQVELSDLQNSGIELLFLSSEPYPFSEKHKRELENLLPGVRIVLVDGEFFSWYGSRLILAFDYFKKLAVKINP